MFQLRWGFAAALVLTCLHAVAFLEAAAVQPRTYGSIHVEPSDCVRTSDSLQRLREQYGQGEQLRLVLQPGLAITAAAVTNGSSASSQPTPSHLRPIVLLLAFHKTGTVWWEQVFLWNQTSHLQVSWIIEPFKPSYDVDETLDVLAINNPTPEVFLSILRSLGDRPFRAVLMTRDPRDCVVSGLFYHTWAPEPWLHMPKEHWGKRVGSSKPMSLQQCLKSMGKAEGLLLELDVFEEAFDRMCGLLSLGHPDMLAMRYEDLWADPEGAFRAAVDWIFGGGGYVPEADALLSDALAYTDAHRSGNRTVREGKGGNGSRHFRKGDPGDWAAHFSAEHRAAFDGRFGKLLVALGYERDAEWVAAGAQQMAVEAAGDGPGGEGTQQRQHQGGDTRDLEAQRHHHHHHRHNNRRLREEEEA